MTESSGTLSQAFRRDAPGNCTSHQKNTENERLTRHATGDEIKTKDTSDHRDDDRQKNEWERVGRILQCTVSKHRDEVHRPNNET